MIDIKSLQKDVEDILIFSQNYPFKLNSEQLINTWKEAKAPFINIFNGETFIKSKEKIKIRLTEQERKDKFKEFISILRDSFDLSDNFIEFLRDNQEGFFDNKVIVPDLEFKINKGAKLYKTFRKFISKEEDARWAQDVASRFAQEDKIEGYLCLSIDPRDFLTMAENEERWCSCQTLDGANRAGILSYMVDETTLIAYIADEEYKHIKCLPPDMTWNSKKWRMLIHTDRKNIIYYNKQYPYYSNSLLIEVYNFLNKIFKTDFIEPERAAFSYNSNLEKGENILISMSQISFHNRIFDLNDIIIDIDNYLGFCDLTSSTDYKEPFVSINRELWSKNERKKFPNIKKIFGIKIGEKIPCPCCGQENLHKEESFLCSSCVAEYCIDGDFFTSCDLCSRRIYDEDEKYYEEEKIYCKRCHQIMRKGN